MINLADTTDLLDQTTQKLKDDSEALTPQAGIALIDQWLPALSAAENTKPIAENLEQLKVLLKTEPVNSDEVFTKLGELAVQLSLLAPDTGSEGEMPSLLEGLSAALKLAAGTSKSDGM